MTVILNLTEATRDSNGTKKVRIAYIISFTNTDRYRRKLLNRTIIQYMLALTVTVSRIFRRVRKVAESEYQLLHVSFHLSIRMEQLGS